MVLGSVAGLSYQSGTDAVVADHFAALKQWLNPRSHKRPLKISLPSTREDVKKSVKKIESSGDARNKALLCLPFVGGARDIYSDESASHKRR